MKVDTANPRERCERDKCFIRRVSPQHELEDYDMDGDNKLDIPEFIASGLSRFLFELDLPNE